MKKKLYSGDIKTPQFVRDNTSNSYIIKQQNQQLIISINCFFFTIKMAIAICYMGCAKRITEYETSKGFGDNR